MGTFLVNTRKYYQNCYTNCLVMSRYFTAEFFVRNREQLQILFSGKAPIVLSANGLLQSSADMTFPFRQDRNFWYVTGVDEPDAILVMDKGKEFIILSEDHEHRARFEGAMTAEQISQASGVAEVLSHKDGWARLTPRLKKVKHIATLAASPPYVQYYGFYTNPARSTMIAKIKGINQAIELLDLKQHFGTMRMIKQPQELDAIRAAIEVTAKTLKSVSSKAFLPQTTEADIDNELRYQFRKKGADGLAFDNVVAAGGNAAIIHHIQNQTPLPKNGLLLLDVGAEVDHYAADITRVYSVGRPTKRMQQVFDLAVDALEQAISMLKTGVLPQKFEEEMVHVVGEKLRILGLIKTIDKESVRKYFPTYTSHHLGLDAHDASDRDAPLAPNMVLAVEPGIYIPEEGIGVRVEENVLITKDGCEVLTSRLPRALTSLTIKEV